MQQSIEDLAAEVAVRVMMGLPFRSHKDILAQRIQDRIARWGKPEEVSAFAYAVAGLKPTFPPPGSPGSPINPVAQEEAPRPRLLPYDQAQRVVRGAMLRSSDPRALFTDILARGIELGRKYDGIAKEEPSA